MELGNQDYKYYTESDGDKKAVAAGAAVGRSLGAWHGLNKAVGKEYEKYKKLHSFMIKLLITISI